MPQPLSRANATGNGVPSTEDLIRVSNTLIGTVDQLRIDMGRRFEEMGGKLDGVCEQVSDIKQSRAIEAALAGQRDDVAKAHTLDRRWVAGIALAATSGLGGFALALLRFIEGH